MSASNSHQLLLAMSKVRLNPAQVAVLAYLAAFTVPAPINEFWPQWVVGAGARTIAEETGLAYTVVYHALWGDRRAGRDGQRGLVELGVIRCWSRGGGAAEAVWSVNPNFEEWAVEWRPTTRTQRPATLREVLFELKSAFAAPWVVAKPEFFAAPQGAAKPNGRKGKTQAWWPIVRRKGKVGFAAPQGAAPRDGYAAPWGAAPQLAEPARSPLSERTSFSPPTAQEEEADQQHPENPAADELVAELRQLTRRRLWGQPVNEVVQAVCDNNVADVGYVIAELRRHRDSFGPKKWRDAVDLAVTMLAAGPPQVATQRSDCELCHGSTWVDADDGVAPCPRCRPEVA